MIKKLKIQNFQSHKVSILNFSKGLNIIIGASDSGKSAILRALKWVIWNRPLGKAFRSNWGGVTLVKLYIDEDLILRKEGREKLYKLNDLEFRAFGTSVPDEIKEFLNINEINLQQQLDKLFLISETPGEVAQYFNKIANLSKIDIAQSNVKKWLKEISKIIEFKENELINYREELTSYKDLDKIEIHIESLENIADKIVNLRNKRKNLSVLLNQIDDLKSKSNQRKIFIKLFEPKINYILNQIKEKNIIQKDLSKLNDLLITIQRNANKIEKYNISIKSEQSIKNLIELYSKKKIIDSNSSKLHNFLIKIKNCDIAIENVKSTYRTLDRRFKKEMGNTCILCGNKLK